MTTFVAVETFLSTTVVVVSFSSTDVLYRFLQYRLLLHCPSPTITAAPPGLSSATTQQERKVLSVSAKKSLEILSRVMKNSRNPTFVLVSV